MSKFSFDVLTDVLSCLPVESLLRFRCLSKPCCSLIDSPDFVKLHLKATSNQGLVVCDILNPSASIYWVDLNSPYLLPMKLDCQLKSYPIEHFDDCPLKSSSDATIEHSGVYVHAFGCCNGLLALYYHGMSIALWNPATRKLQVLPDFWDHSDGDGLLPVLDGCPVNCEFANGFGYDVTSDDYKVIRVIRHGGEVPEVVMVYSLKANSWRRTNDFPYVDISPQECGVFFASSLHWVVDEVSTVDEEEVEMITRLAAFDLGDEKFCLVPLPAGFRDFNHIKSFGVLGGCLCMLALNHYEHSYYSTIWMLKEYGVKESWIKLCSINFIEEPIKFDFVDHSMKCVGYLKIGNKVLIGALDRFLYWYDLKNKRFYDF